MTSLASLARPPVNIADYQDAANYLASKGGGVLTLGPGDYTVTQRLMLGHRVRLKGAGRGLTRLAIAHATEPCIDLGGGDSACQEGGVSDLSVQVASTRNPGAPAILVNGMGKGVIERVETVDHPTGIKAISTGNSLGLRLRHVGIRCVQANDGVGLHIAGAVGVEGDDIFLQGSGAEDLSNPNAPFCGLFIQDTNNVIFRNLRSFHWKWGAVVTGGSILDFVKCVFEFNNNEGFEINSQSRVERVSFDACDFWYCGGRGLFFQATSGAPILSGIDFNFCRIIANRQGGIRQNYGRGLSVLGGTICANSRAAANTYSGVTLAVGDAQIQDVRFCDAYDLKDTVGAAIPSNLHKYDIEIQAGANITAVNNVLRGHTTAPLLNASAGANVVVAPNY